MSDQPLMLTSLALRAVADAAESVRCPPGGHEPGFMETTYDSTTGHWSTRFVPYDSGSVPHSGPTRVVTPVDTRTVMPRPATLDVCIRAEGMLAGTMESLAQYDAVFWSESAVEKFVFPYYASKSQFAAAEVLSALADVFYHKKHDPHAAKDANDEPVPFAVAHLPRSTYAELTETAALGADLALLHMDPSGNVNHVCLSDYLREREKARRTRQGQNEDLPKG